MPGYRTLPVSISGVSATLARHAELLQAAGETESAIITLEAALHEQPGDRSWPAWLCGRLAALYRAARRYEDEARLLTRYRETHSGDETRCRFEARLYKALALAAQHEDVSNGALESIRDMRVRRRRAARARPSVPNDGRAHDPGGAAGVPDTVDAILDDARRRAAPVDMLVRRARGMFGHRGAVAPPEGITYSEVLLGLLGAYFETSYEPSVPEARS